MRKDLEIHRTATGTKIIGTTTDVHATIEDADKDAGNLALGVLLAMRATGARELHIDFDDVPEEFSEAPIEISMTSDMKGRFKLLEEE